ncbi:MAG: DUF559 domain-containing protein [Phycisphaerales bacterium]|nr:DUF559 domain-containing protein [Phycisphaerales bacterium]
MRTERPGTSRARELRQQETPPEGIIWSKLRNRRLGGLKFRRQYACPPYTLDFYCPDAQLAVEIDGHVHRSPQQAEHDAKRDAFLAKQGIAVFRVPAREVSVNLDGADHDSGSGAEAD